MTLSFLGWLNGITALAIVSFSIILGLYIVYKSKKTNAKLLFIMGLMIIFSGIGWIGSVIDFFVILITGNNVSRSLEIIFIISFMSIAPMALLASMLITEIIMREVKHDLKFSKWYIISVFIVLGIFYELILFFDTKNSIQITYPEVSGENLISSNIIFISILGIIMAIYGATGLIFGGIGFLYKSRKTTGVLKKKYSYLSLGFIFYMIFAPLDSIIGIFSSIYILILPIRAGVIFSFWFWYLGLREETEKVKLPKKEITVEGDLIRISRYKKEDLTEEEVSISKERKICLVCKGKVGGYNIFLCTECDAFYCAKCARALEDLENTCWVCGEAIDKAKPVKPFEKEKEEIDLEITEKSLNKNKFKN